MRRPGPIAHIVAFLAFCALIGLGVWQVQRLKHFTELRQQIAQLETAPPQPIAVALGRVSNGEKFKLTRVRLDCPDLELRSVLRLYWIYEGLAGYRLIAACPLASGPYSSILVDRGFVGTPGGELPHAVPGRPISQPVVGVLRAPPPKALISTKNDPAGNLWFWRDTPAMARTLNAPKPAPVFLVLESPAPSTGEPRPTPIEEHFPNNLGYAITWFGLAAALVGVYLAMLLGKRPG